MIRVAKRDNSIVDFNLDKIKDKGIHYVHCMLYGNLIGITFMEGIYNDLNKEYQTKCMMIKLLN